MAIDFADDPSGGDGIDKFGRTRFAQQAVGDLERLRRDGSSGVVGVIGPWGSGKTRVIDMVVAELREPWTVAQFNPWLLGDEEQLGLEFLGVLRDALTRAGRLGQVEEVLRKSARKFGKLAKAIPWVGDAASGIVDSLSEDPPLGEQQRKLAEKLGELKVPVLVVVDDVDRLHPDELLAVFRLVRNFGRLPYVFYLIAYDEQTLLDVLVSTDLALGDPERALAYLEKMVQVRVDLAPLEADHVIDMMDEQWEAVLQEAGIGELSDSQRQRYERVRAVLTVDKLHQPRRIKRLFVQMSSALRMVAHEVDPVDLLVLTFLRTFHPQLYASLWQRRGELAVHPFQASTPTSADVSDRVSITAAADALGVVVGELFPGESPDWVFDDAPARRADHLGELCRDQRVGSADYVDRYFLLGIGADDVSDAVVRRLLRDLANPGTGIDAHRQHVDRIVRAAAVRPGRIMRKLWRASEEEHQLIGGLRLGAVLYEHLSRVWGVPAEPVAEWAGNLIWPELPDPPAPDLGWLAHELTATPSNTRFCGTVLACFTAQARASNLLAADAVPPWPRGFVAPVVQALWVEFDDALEARVAAEQEYDQGRLESGLFIGSDGVTQRLYEASDRLRVIASLAVLTPQEAVARLDLAITSALTNVVGVMAATYPLRFEPALTRDSRSPATLVDDASWPWIPEALLETGAGHPRPWGKPDSNDVRFESRIGAAQQALSQRFPDPPASS